MNKTEELSEEVGLLNHQLYSMISDLEELQDLRSFLFELSPYKGSEPIDIMILRNKSCLLDDLNCLKETIQNLEKPVLYFKLAEDIMNYFTDLEDATFTIYSHSKVISNLAEIGTKYMNELTVKCGNDLEVLKEICEELNGEVVQEEKRADLLKKFCTKYVFNDFAKLVFKLESVRMTVEECYDDAVTTNVLNLGAAALMKGIELKAVEMTEATNPSNPETVKLARQLNKEAKLKEIAQKKFEKTFREYELVLKGLRNS